MRSFAGIIVLAFLAQTSAKVLTGTCGFSDDNWKELCHEMSIKKESPADVAQTIVSEINKKLESKGQMIADMIKEELGKDFCTTKDVASACGISEDAYTEESVVDLVVQTTR